MTAVQRYWNLRATNHLLSLAVIALAGYITIWPFLPTVTWWARHEAPVFSSAPTVILQPTIPQQNTLVIPSLGLTQLIHEGLGEATLNKGVWRRPLSSSPDKQSNTVLTGHRFTYSGHSVFYYLDKVQVGEQIHIFWESKRYTYTVAQLLEVSPDRGEIEAATAEPTLTIYTCTPVWSAKNRLVIQATLNEETL